MNLRVGRVLAVLSGLLLVSFSFGQSKQIKLPDQLVAAIAKIGPEAGIVRPEDVDGEECESIGLSPGLVRADFNGDGREDFATLLKVKVSKEETIWQGKALREARFALVLFLDNGHGSYKTMTVYRYDGFVPTVGLIYAQSGAVRNRETQRMVRLPHAAFTLAFCGKSATTYYISKDRIRSVPIAD